LGIRQVITMPFFLETKLDGEPRLEFVGNLFAAKRSEISEEDIRLLSAFARQVSTAILSERRQMRANIIQQLILDIHHSLNDEDQILQRIARGVVDDLGYAGAMVATYEPGDVLPVRAFYVDPAMVDMQHIDAWVDEIATKYAGRRLSLSDPAIARVYPHQEAYLGNLSTKAATERHPVVSNRLFDLFTPIAPDAAASAIDGIQQALGIHQVITVPFFNETYQNGKLEREFVGNLFAATRAQQFQAWEIELLGMFGQQAAAGLKNARTYRRSEARRITAEIFGKMAFSATASLHAFRNSIGAIRMSVQLIELLRTNDGGLNVEVWDKQYPDLTQRLDRLTELLEGLHEPFRPARDVSVNINDCLKYALTRIEVPEAWLELSLTKDLPNVYTLAEMLTEAIKVLLKNALETLREKEQAGTLPKGQPVLFVSSRLTVDGQVEVIVRDCGTGIRPEMLSKLFDLGATTKDSGMGFGLFWTKDYIEGLGGSIDLETKVGEGTTFRIRLPVKRGEQEAEEKTSV
jgi:signal transduction histidine kinase